MNIRFGASPLAWSNADVPQLGGDGGLDVFLAQAHDAGFAGVELSEEHLRDGRAARRMLEHCALEPVCSWTRGNLLADSPDAAIRRAQEDAQRCATIGARMMVYMECTGAVHADVGTPLSLRPRLPDAGFEPFGERLTALADACAALGVRLVYRPHMGTVVQFQREIDLLMQHTGASVGLLIDTGHLAYAGAHAGDLLQQHAARIALVHCKDVRPEVLRRARHRDNSFPDAVAGGVFTVPGDGCIDYSVFASRLMDAGYAGWAVVEAEQNPATAPPLEYARMGLRHLAGAFASAGYEVQQ
jgi:inosose dehydratase